MLGQENGSLGQEVSKHDCVCFNFFVLIWIEREEVAPLHECGMAPFSPFLLLNRQVW